MIERRIVRILERGVENILRHSIQWTLRKNF